MELEKILILGFVFSCLVLIFYAIRYSQKSRNAIKDTQAIVSDKKLIEFVNSQPDKIVNFQSLMDEYGLTKFEARGRLRHLQYYGIFKFLSSGNGMKYYYTLWKPIEGSSDLKLSDDPFMTIEDLMLIFKHYDHQVSLQELCLCTGLSVKIILEELKYFEKEGVIRSLIMSQNGGVTQQRIYKLREPYRSNPDGYIELKDANLVLKGIYKNFRNV